MSNFFNPSKSAELNAERSRIGYVSRISELPPACARLKNQIVFCEADGDKRFYECRSENGIYKWFAVTPGPHRSYLVPVEKLCEDEERAIQRNGCYDMIVSAINEIAFGLERYHVSVAPLCYKKSYDAKYEEGITYYVWNDKYDRAAFIITSDEVPVTGKSYYTRDLRTGDYILFTGTKFEEKTVYYEETRPMFVKDPDQVTGQPILHTVYIPDGPAPDKVTLEILVPKLNEVIDRLNVNNAGLDKATTEMSPKEICALTNRVIDEVNPFSNTWQTLLNRVADVERQLKDLQKSNH